MATFITSLIFYGFIACIVGAIGKVIYDIQQNKKKENEADALCKTEAEFEAKEQFQKLAGIGQPKNEIDSEIWKYIADKVSKEGFPEPDKSIPVTTATITTIGGSYGDSDPLASVPMSRVSKEAKKKMAEIAKQDIKENLEKKTSIFPEEVEYSDEYNKPDYSKSKKKTSSKKKSNPKQFDGIKSEGEFVKTRKKATKKTK